MRRIKPVALAFWISMALLTVMLVVLGLQQRGDDEEELKNLALAVERAAVQCYALEGQYPMSAEYLVKHYGVTYDAKKYIISYSTFGSNIRPFVKILKLAGT